MGFLQINEDAIQVPVPSGGPAALLAPVNLVPQGYFLLPRDGAHHNGPNGTGFDNAYRGFAFCAAHHSMMVQGNNTYGWTAEVTIPATSADDVVHPVADWLQDFHDTRVGQLQFILEGHAFNSGACYPNGQFVYNNRLIGDSLVYYDANNLTRYSFYAHGLTLSDDASFTGMVTMGPPDKQGFVAGYMANIPPEWQARLGGPVFCGQTGLSIVSRQSWGPDAWVFNPDDIGVVNPVPAVPVLNYDQNHPTLGLWDAGQPPGGDFTQATEVTGAVFPVGTDTVIFFGRQGVGVNCYGSAYGLDGSVPQTITIADNIEVIFPPCLGLSKGHGNGAWPYHYWMWFYNARDLHEVALGHLNPWDVLPYMVWPFDWGGTTDATGGDGIQGVAYDPDTQTLYVSIIYGDAGLQQRIVVFHIDPIGPAPATVTVPTGLVATSSNSYSIDLTWNAVAGINRYVVYRNGKPLTINYSTSCTDISITPSTTFTYTVQSQDDLGRLSALSVPASATTHSYASTPPDVTIASVPSGVRLTWGASFDNHGVESLYYQVYRNNHPLGTHPDSYVRIVVTTEHAFIDTTASAGATYIYVVQSLDRGLVLGGALFLPPFTFTP